MDDFIGLAFSKPNKKIQDVTEIQDLDFHSDYPLLKIAFSDEDIVDVTVDGEVSAEVVITHDLGYKPRVLVKASIENGFFYNDIDSYMRVPFYQQSSSMGFWDSVGYSVTTTTLTITVSGSGWTDPARVGYAYYIFYDPE